MISSDYIQEMAAYHRWQNDTVYGCCDDIGLEERTKDRGMFFGSIHNTLDHMCMINEGILTFLNGDLLTFPPMDTVVWPDWEELKSIRLSQDNQLRDGAQSWTQDWLSSKTNAKDAAGNDLPTIQRWVMVVQIFNHQTHHRSQVTSVLHAMGVDYGSTDIPWRPGAGFFAG